MSEATAPAIPTQGQAKSADNQPEAQDQQQQTQELAGQAQDRVREELEQRAKQTGEKVSGTANDLRSVGEELRKQGKEGSARIADRAADQTEKVGSYLAETNPDQILQDVEDFGRRRPGALLVGGLVAGAVAARFLKASSHGRYQQRGVGQQRTLARS